MDLIRRYQWPIALCGLALVAVVWSRGWKKMPAGNVRVTGAFKFENGEPLSDVMGVVRFDPEETYQEKGGTRGSSVASLSSNGSFELMTRDDGDGVPIGDYRAVLAIRKRDGGVAEQVHDDYTHFETTPWRAHVTAEGPNHFVFIIEPATRRPNSEYHPTRRQW